MRKRTLALLASVVLNMVLVIVSIGAIERARAARARATAFDLYCDGVRMALRQDIADLRNPRYRDHAIERFLQPVSFHSLFEIDMCRAMPLDLMRCANNHDADCLEGLAIDALAAIPPAL
jgi:hypothetical protein